jgi:hypothetical protein
VAGGRRWSQRFSGWPNFRPFHARLWTPIIWGAGGDGRSHVFSRLGYGVLWNALLLRVELIGLDPYLGVFHVGSQRHAALVSDLIEPLRTFLVDPFMVS